MEISFCELRAKIVVNILDGKELGNVIDILIDTCCARVLGIVVPGEKKGFSFFRSSTNLYIPFNRICKIGKDVILVELNSTMPNCSTQNVNTCNEKTAQNNVSTYASDSPINQTDYKNLESAYINESKNLRNY